MTNYYYYSFCIIFLVIGKSFSHQSRLVPSTLE